jgi:hypothetical protein
MVDIVTWEEAEATLLDAWPLHGYAIAQRIHLLSRRRSASRRFSVPSASEIALERLGQGCVDDIRVGA